MGLYIIHIILHIHTSPTTRFVHDGVRISCFHPACQRAQGAAASVGSGSELNGVWELLRSADLLQRETAHRGAGDPIALTSDLQTEKCDNALNVKRSRKS